MRRCAFRFRVRVDGLRGAVETRVLPPQGGGEEHPWLGIKPWVLCVRRLCYSSRFLYLHLSYLSSFGAVARRWSTTRIRRRESFHVSNGFSLADRKRFAFWKRQCGATAGYGSPRSQEIGPGDSEVPVPGSQSRGRARIGAHAVGVAAVAVG